MRDYSASQKTITNVYPGLFELMTPETEEAFVRFIGYLEGIGDKDQLEQEFLARLLDRLKRQSETDLPWFTSHNAGHSLRVLQKMQRIMFESPDFLSRIYQRYDLQKHPKKHDIAMLLGSFVALVHDIGYSEFVNIKNTPKHVHAQLGAEVVDTHFLQPLKQLLPMALSTEKRVLTAVFDAVSYHNADDSRFTSRGFKKRLISLVKRQREFYGLSKTYHPASIKEEPFLVLLRFADNLDFSRNRLFAHQQSELYLHLLDSLSVIKHNVSYRGSDEWAAFLREHYLDQMKQPVIDHRFSESEEFRILKHDLESGEEPVYPGGKLSLMATALLSALPGDFSHVYSNYIVDDVRYQRRADGNYVAVRFASDSFDAAPLVKNYQLKRMAESLTSCSMAPSRLVDRVFINSISESGEKETFPLSAYTWMHRPDGGSITKDPFLTERLIGPKW
ncbi:hypothetical protein [Parendozoicomonas sp. Alg238-R29]|uniref:hypothetical protein n=1 Tax=Parendozoicomonas sp. Alg238-R29 TaxID=2993446 RepID=UPI00248E4A6D|nr:hypothetical protein [Parendozoicomonas sp. Alg238-R29]